METRMLLTRMAEVLAADADDPLERLEHSRDRIRRRTDGSLFNPTPAEIRAATLSIQAEWSDDEWQKRCSDPNRSHRWRVPRVRVMVSTDNE